MFYVLTIYIRFYDYDILFDDISFSIFISEFEKYFRHTRNYYEKKQDNRNPSLPMAW